MLLSHFCPTQYLDTHAYFAYKKRFITTCSYLNVYDLWQHNFVLCMNFFSKGLSKKDIVKMDSLRSTRVSTRLSERAFNQHSSGFTGIKSHFHFSLNPAKACECNGGQILHAAYFASVNGDLGLFLYDLCLKEEPRAFNVQRVYSNVLWCRCL